MLFFPVLFQKNNRFPKGSLFFFLLLPLFFPSLIQSRPIDSLIEHKVILNFEEPSKLEKIVTKGNSDLIPEVSFSKVFTSPELKSSQSLLFRFTEESRFLPIEYLLETPVIIQDYVFSFEFHIYTSSRGGEIYFFLEDGLSQTHKILISNLNFTGWKKIQIFPKSLFQNDILFKENRKLKLNGFFISPPKDSESGKEFLIAIDDILVQSLPKYKTVP